MTDRQRGRRVGLDAGVDGCWGVSVCGAWTGVQKEDVGYGEAGRRVHVGCAGVIWAEDRRD